MLITKAVYYQSWDSNMNDAEMAASIKFTLLEISKQALALGNGLRNAAPATTPTLNNPAGTPNNSVAYLLAIAASTKIVAESCSEFLPPSA